MINFKDFFNIRLNYKNRILLLIVSLNLFKDKKC
jgi:hypothetical protein